LSCGAISLRVAFQLRYAGLKLSDASLRAMASIASLRGIAAFGRVIALVGTAGLKLAPTPGTGLGRRCDEVAGHCRHLLGAITG
jgi:hypothetical protein